MKSVGIVGFGRFGQTLYRLIKDDFLITLYDKKTVKKKGLTNNTKLAKNLADVYQNEVIFFAVPISSFEEVILSHRKFFKKEHLLIDVLSVKLYPAKIFKKYLKDGPQVLLTHPMFGPDSSKEGFVNLPIILDQFTTDNINYEFWREYFKSKKLRVLEMPAKSHDRLAAYSQGLTHFIGRLLDAYRFTQSPVDSLGAKKLLEVKEQTCNDSWQLFEDLQHFNPYTKKMRIKLGEKYDKLYNKLLPACVNSDFITFGIQGGKGSFNEEALLFYLQKAGIKKYRVKYLYTSANVLQALHKGDIDRGQLAIQNLRGGIVNESLEAIARFKFKIVEEFAIKISHALMIKKEAKFSEITTIMAHPQVFVQCGDTLAKKYPHLKKTSGKKELIDHAMAAKYLSENKLPGSIAIMGSKILAEIYNLQVIEDNLQDIPENYTTFLQISRA